MRCFLSHLPLLCGLILGCGGDTPSEEPAGSENREAAASASPNAAVQPASANSSDRVPLVTASIENDAPAPADAAVPEPTDEVVTLLREIQGLRQKPYPADQRERDKETRTRNLKIIDVATHVLALTLDKPERTQQFQTGIAQLLEARFQLAITGGQEEADQLFADVQALQERDPRSPATQEGIYYLARFAHTMAGLRGKQAPAWFETFSHWARVYSDTFPEQEERAVKLLFGAARSCELRSLRLEDADTATRLMSESRLCYTALAEQWPERSEGQEAAAVLRRLNLSGKPLTQFSGPTLNGEFVAADEFRGRPTLIYFWESESKDFIDHVLPVLNQVRDKLDPARLRVIGVSLDQEEDALKEFLKENPLPGEQIFFVDEDQRSWNSPLVRFWGISRAPTIWTVRADGIVDSAAVSETDLLKAIQSLLQSNQP